MIILPEQGVIIVATPRTGSRSINAAIIDVRPKGMIVTGEHHDEPHIVAETAHRGGYEVFTILREPEDQLHSWISHAQHWYDPVEFIRNYVTPFVHRDTMNIYRDVVHRHFLFNNNGHRDLLNSLELDTELPHIGGMRYPKGNPKLDEACKGLAHERFALDFKLYDTHRIQLEEQAP